MMVILKKAVPRRTLLRGLGVTVALPFLDAMVPALHAYRNSVATPTVRLGVVYVPHGAVMDKWTPGMAIPSEQGRGWRITPILEPLQQYRSDMLVLSGLRNTGGAPLTDEPPELHSRISASFLTGTHVKATAGADPQASVSMDQIAAGRLAQDTRLPSLELSLESTDLSGACERDFSCAYVNTLCWRNPDTPLPMENRPRAVFESLFGNIERRGTVLDGVNQAATELAGTLGTTDRGRVVDYLDAVRDVERRIQAAGESGIPASFEEYAKVMFDLQVLAYQGDIARVATFMVGKELSDRTYAEIRVPEGHHSLSHHHNDGENLHKLVAINTFHTTLFAYYLGRLRATPDGDGSLLDHAMLIYGSGMSDSDSHDLGNLPILLAGRGAGLINVPPGGRHLLYRDGPPLANLHLALLEKLGVPLERFGDSTGRLRYLG